MTAVGAIFLRYGDQLVPMVEQPYDAEVLLQTLIAEHPEILAADETGESGAWLLVRREAGVPDREGGAGRWSLDHLFLDRDGVPTLVEVKRSSDPRARREVVAQMLDYAANAAAYWGVEVVREWFESEHGGAAWAEQRLRETFDVDDPDEYWETVKTNLAADRIRLVFVGDEIAGELRRIIELLNRQMSEVEVFAIEVKQYVDSDGERQTLVPRVIGQTEAARAAKSGRRRTMSEWGEPELLGAIPDPDERDVAQRLIEWAHAHPDVRLDYGRGGVQGTAQVRLQRDEQVLLHAFNIRSWGKVEIPFDFMQGRRQEPFAESRSARDELRRRIDEAVPGANIPAEEQRPRPSFRLALLDDETAYNGFLAAIEWAFDEARRTAGSR